MSGPSDRSVLELLRHFAEQHKEDEKLFEGLDPGHVLVLFKHYDAAVALLAEDGKDPPKGKSGLEGDDPEKLSLTPDPKAIDHAHQLRGEAWDLAASGKLFTCLDPAAILVLFRLYDQAVCYQIEAARVLQAVADSCGYKGKVMAPGHVVAIVDAALGKPGARAD